MDIQEQIDHLTFRVGLLKDIALGSGTLSRWALDADLTEAQYESALRTLEAMDVARRKGNASDFEVVMAAAIGNRNIHQRCNLLVLALQGENKYAELTAPLVKAGMYDEYEDR